MDRDDPPVGKHGKNHEKNIAMVDLSHRNGGFLWFFFGDSQGEVGSFRFLRLDETGSVLDFFILQAVEKIGSELGYVFQGLQKAKKGIALEFAFSRACKKQIGFFIGNLIFVCLMGGWLDRN